MNRKHKLYDDVKCLFLTHPLPPSVQVPLEEPTTVTQTMHTERRVTR